MTCRLKTLFLPATFAFAVFTASSQTYGYSPAPSKGAPNLFDALAPAVVKLTIRLNGITTMTGTGFFVSTDGTLVSNRHVLRNLIHEHGYTLELTAASGIRTEIKNFEVGACGEKSDADLCEIRVPLKTTKYFSLSHLAPLVNDSAFTIGHPHDHDFVFSSGKLKAVQLNSIGSEEMLLTTALGPGSSGGPIFDQSGALTGVASRYSSANEHENFAVSFKELRLFLTSPLPFVPPPIARERIASAFHQRMRSKVKTINAKAETTTHQFKFGDDVVTISVPKIFEKCREVREKNSSVHACVSAGDTGIFTIQKFEMTSANPLISGRQLLPPKILDLLSTENTSENRTENMSERGPLSGSEHQAPSMLLQDALEPDSPYETKRRAAFYSKVLPAECGRVKSGLFAHAKMCEFAVLNDTEPGSRSMNLWIQRGSKIYSFSAWMADPAQASFFNEVPGLVVKTIRLTNGAQVAAKMPFLVPLEWNLSAPWRHRPTPLLSSSRDH